jgi:hypothetical protein
MTRLHKSQLRAIAPQVAAGEVPVVPAPPKRRRNEESETQRALIIWWRNNCRLFGVPEILLFSIPNGGGGGEKRGHWLKLEGCRKGAPDLFLAAPRVVAGWYINEDKSLLGYTGLFLELKTTKGTVSPEQEVFHQRLTEQGYAVKVCRSLPECIDTITTYLTK